MAYICGILINVVGFAGAVGTPVPIGATYIYRLNFFTGFIVSGGVYYTLCRVFPVPALSPTGQWMEVGDFENPSLVSGADEESIAAQPVSSATESPERGEKKWWNIRSRGL